MGNNASLKSEVTAKRQKMYVALAPNNPWMNQWNERKVKTFELGRNVDRSALLRNL